MGKRLFVMALAIIIFALVFSWVSYTPSSQREPNTYYFGFFETFLLVVIYAGPIYLIAGTPLSVLIDRVLGKSNGKMRLRRYFFGLGMYSLAGASVGILFIVIGGIFAPSEVFLYLLVGLFASTLYYHLSLLVSTAQRKSNLD